MRLVVAAEDAAGRGRARRRCWWRWSRRAPSAERQVDAAGEQQVAGAEHARRRRGEAQRLDAWPSRDGRSRAAGSPPLRARAAAAARVAAGVERRCEPGHILLARIPGCHLSCWPILGWTMRSAGPGRPAALGRRRAQAGAGERRPRPDAAAPPAAPRAQARASSKAPASKHGHAGEAVGADQARRARRTGGRSRRRRAGSRRSR